MYHKFYDIIKDKVDEELNEDDIEEENAIQNLQAVIRRKLVIKN
jgi:hypothetical protein